MRADHGGPARRRIRKGLLTGILAPGWRGITVSIVAVMSLSAFESIATATAMPVVARDLDALTVYTWAFNAFIVASLLGMVLGGAWCDTRGPRAPVIVGVSMFAAGSIIAGLAPSFEILVVGRAIQGLGSGIDIVAIYVVIARYYPEDMRPKAFSALAASWVLPSLIGPPIAGWLADEVSWRLVFLVVPVLVAWPIAAMVRAVSRDEPTGAPFAWRRLRFGALAAGALIMVQQGVLIASVLSPFVVLLGVIGVGVAARALLPERALTMARGLPTTVMMRGLFAAAFFTAEIFIPLALVLTHGVSSTQAGLVLAASAVTWVGGSTLQARLDGAADRSRLVQFGAVLMTVAIACMPLAVVDVGFFQQVPIWTAMIVWAIGAFGLGLAFPSISVQALRLTSEQTQGATSAGLQIIDSIGVVVSAALIGAVYAGAEARGSVTDWTFALIWWLCALIGVAAIALAPRMRPAAMDAASIRKDG